MSDKDEHINLSFFASLRMTGSKTGARQNPYLLQVLASALESPDTITFSHLSYWYPYRSAKDRQRKPGAP
jgi:hypothetical protein